MVIERRVLRVLEQRCRFTAPRVIAEAPDGTVDVRTAVPGVHDTWAVFRHLKQDEAASRNVGATLGEILADLHTNVPSTDVKDWIPHRPDWPEPRAVIAERLPQVVDDPHLHAAADAVIAAYEDAIESTADSDRVLVHGDLGLHNVSIDALALRVNGIFDWETACWSDRHVDFRYLAFDVGRLELLESAIESYGQLTGVEISRERVALYNAASAIGFLAYRVGVTPETRWCGRTLREDLEWTRHAIAHVNVAR